MKTIVLMWLVLPTFLSWPSQAQSSSPAWIETWQSSPAALVDLPPPPGTPKLPGPVKGTLRFRFGISRGGSQLAVKLSNELGDKPLKVAGASIARAGKDMNAVAGSMHVLTFSGQASVVLAPGVSLYSDPVELRTDDMADLLGSVYFAEPASLLPFGTSMLLADSDAVATETFPGTVKLSFRPIMTAVEVTPDRPTRVIVALGDSITDGLRDNPVEPHGWTATLTRRLETSHGRQSFAVVSAGISGNQVLRTMMGPAALTRLDRDVMSVPGVSDIVLLEGINDIGISGATPFGTMPPLVLDDLIRGYRQIARQAHLHGLRIFIGTLTPMEGAFYFQPEKERLRQQVNAWIRSARDFDGVIDFEAAVRDPEHPTRLKAAYDSGDHLHPGPAGYKAMGDAIDLALFR